jgi:integrase
MFPHSPLAAGGLENNPPVRSCRGLVAPVGCYTFRATRTTASHKGGGTLEHAQQIAAHESPRTTKLYHRTRTRSRSMRSSALRFGSYFSRRIITGVGIPPLPMS